MTITNLKKRILEISYKHKISHIGSSISAVDIIDRIYKAKNEEDIFILSSGHAGLALYVVLEKHYGYDAEELFLEHGIHPHRDLEHKIYCSTGSLGAGITIACGAALADKNRKVYCLCSDGEAAEGSFWEAINFIDEKLLMNLLVYINCNGFAAYKGVDTHDLIGKIEYYERNNNIYCIKTDFSDIPFLDGIAAHYKVMSEDDWKLIKNL